MNTLFDADADDDADIVTAPDRPSAKTVRALEGYGYRREAVRLWSPEKANTVLHSCKKEEAIVLRRADATARQQDGASRGQPSVPERLEAARCVEEAMGRGIDELHSCVMYTVYALSDDELKRLAGYLIRVFRGENQ